MYNQAILTCRLLPEVTSPEAKERIELEAALRAGDLPAGIARRMGCSQETVSQEIGLNGGRNDFRAAAAHRAARRRQLTARRGFCEIAEHPPLRAAIHARLQRGWSTEVIAGSLKHGHPDLSHMHPSHESIFRYVYVHKGEIGGREFIVAGRCAAVFMDATEPPLSRVGKSARWRYSCGSRSICLVVPDPAPRVHPDQKRSYPHLDLSIASRSHRFQDTLWCRSRRLIRTL